MMNAVNATGCGGCNGGVTTVPNPAAAATTIVPITVASVKCSCFGCQNTVAGYPSCGNNDGYGGTDTVTVTLSDGTKMELEITGENVIAAGGSNRSLTELAMKALQATGGKYNVTDTTIIQNIDGHGNVQASSTYGQAKPGYTNVYDEQGNIVYTYTTTTVTSQTGGTVTVYAPTDGSAGGWIQPSPHSPPVCVGTTSAPRPPY